MDDIVAAALAKWPNVPHCRGWLGLDARGDWYLRDDRVQSTGSFPRAKGSRLEHAGLRAFIERNYACDGAGAWYFQNGPQRVYVELEAAPWVWRLQCIDSSQQVAVHSHSGLPAVFASAWLDEQGRLFLATDLGLGLVHTLDMETAADAIECGLWQVGVAKFADLPGQFRYRLSPASDAAAQLP
ncbi:MAG: hypothetical protein CFE40_11620 [Burkholderiales bacterium PBB1]|nr:MAG: hypothetical protein CFE40_11620 [Burkholderiales bacterium PBB1]